MQRDFRSSAAYRAVHDIYHRALAPGFHEPSEVHSLTVTADGRCIFEGSVLTGMEGLPHHALFDLDLNSGYRRAITSPGHHDRMPRFSPDEREVAFLSDRSRPGVFDLYRLSSGEAQRLTNLDGTIELFEWAPDGAHLLAVVAGLGADTAGKDGAITTPREEADFPAWMPDVESGSEAFRWRTLWIIHAQTGAARHVELPGINVWEAAWCGNDRIGVLVSDRPEEAGWYAARAAFVQLPTAQLHEVYRPRLESNWPAGSPDGRYLAIAEGCCSDRSNVAGDLMLLVLDSGRAHRIDTRGTDVTQLFWRGAESLVYVGQREFDVVIGEYSPAAGTTRELWCGAAPSSGFWHPWAMPYGRNDLVMVAESFHEPPAISVIHAGALRRVHELRNTGSDWVAARIGEVSPLRWRAPDGLEIHGWALEPRRPRPHATVMEIHGGPVWAWRNVWPGRLYSLLLVVLLDQSYCVFLPNPRGSTYRGQDFANRVRGDMGGADTLDYLSGIDHMIRLGISDSARLGVTGSSYGGFMSAWLITQDARFAAAVPRHCVSDWFSFHQTSNVPHFDEIFLGSDPLDPTGHHVTRSPVRFAHRVRTPTLQLAGALDRISPPTQALQFHRALREHDVESVLVTYPQEGHGPRTVHASLDARARLLHWFMQHMPAG